MPERASPRPVTVVAAEAPARARSSNYPEPFFSRMLKRDKRPLGDLFGLANFGVNLTRLNPGGESALRHAHTKQDEFVYILEGRPTLVTDAGRTRLAPGMCAGFPGRDGRRAPSCQRDRRGRRLSRDRRPYARRRRDLPGRRHCCGPGRGEVAIHPQGRDAVLRVFQQARRSLPLPNGRRSCGALSARRIGFDDRSFTKERDGATWVRCVPSGHGR